MSVETYIRGGVEGIYRCEIPDAMNVTKTIYIGVYSVNMCTLTPQVFVEEMSTVKCQLHVIGNTCSNVN